MKRVETEADIEVRNCLVQGRSFALVAGAGSGKTDSLTEALDFLRRTRGRDLRRNGQQIACITYTNRAAAVIKARLRFDELFLVSTLHSFLWSAIRQFQPDIRETLRSAHIPALIAKAREKDNGGNSQSALRARERAAELEAELAQIDGPSIFSYEDAVYGNYGLGQLGHDDVIAIASFLLTRSRTFGKILGFRFPYIFIDEAQDTFPAVVDGLNLISKDGGPPLVGYFGDPWQQIYDDRAGAFAPPTGGLTITKTENFRCSKSVIRFLNAFRTDVDQYAAGDNSERAGSVRIRLVRAETPELAKGRYSEAQMDRALARMDQTLAEWDWRGGRDEVRLFLVRQMIARRLGFFRLNALFTGTFASTRAQGEYEAGEHFLLRPLRTAVWPLIAARESGEQRRLIDILRAESPEFAVDGPNRDRPLRQMVGKATEVLDDLHKLWIEGKIRDVLAYCRDRRLCSLPKRLREALSRAPRQEEYNEQLHAEEKGDWLCDDFLKMGTGEIGAYCDFVNNNTAFSTQHGVKGEQHQDVLVVLDDVEAAWNNYSFAKLLTPATSGQPTAGQLDRTRRLAYVCFSRVLDNLRVLLFTPDPISARAELLERRLLAPDQIEGTA